MTFKVERTSLGFRKDKSPCEEAIKHEYVVKEQLFDLNSLEFLGISEREWKSKGANHRIEDNKYTRDLRETEWLVEIDSLEALNSFINKYGRCVISLDRDGGQSLTIEMYDDYRE